MNVKDTLIKDFVNAINTKPEKKTAMYYGEIVEVTNDSGVKKAYVHLDGSESDIKTPIVEGTEVLEGDRVLVTIENHQAVVLANITSPASARTAKNYMDLSEEDEGLVIGALNDENNNYNVLIKADGVYIRDGQDVMAIYGGDGTYIYADGEPAAEFTAEGIQFFTDLANYAKFDPVTGEFTSQSLEYLHLDNLEANFAHITDGVIDNATIDHADINDLEANYAHITEGVIDNAKIGYADVEDLEANYAHITEGVIDNAKIGYADVEDLEANYAHITQGVIDNAKIGYADVENLDANYAHISNGTIDNAKIGYADVNDLNAHYASITNGVITNATIDQANVNNLQSNYAHITNGFIDNADIKEADVENLTSKYAHITNGYIDNADIKEANVENLTSKYAHITQGVIDNAKIGYADVNGLNAHYATIDMANVNNAWIENGVVKDAAISDAQIIGVSANKLTAGTIDASDINVANLRAKNLIVEKMNGQPILGGYELVNKNSTGYSGKNPSNEGWYEYSNGTFVTSTDTTVNMSKAYYKDGTQVALYDQAYIDGLENDLNQRIDGAVEVFSGSVVPTLVNYPAVDWSSTQMASHVGNIYYLINEASNENGYCYRFTYDNTTSSYKWVLIKDSDVTAALADISDLQTFQSETTSWINETDDGLETIRQNHTSLSGVVNKTVKSSTQLWFTKANTTAPTAPTSEVTSDSTSGNAWRRVVPTYNASYPYYFYCWQYKYVDNTFGWSAVIYDQATTEAEERARTGVANAATADGKAVSAQNTANANIKSSVQLWFTKSNTTAPSKPTSQVTNNSATGSNSYNKWNLVVPVYNSSYPYYYYCYQQQKGDGTYQWSDVVYDQATSEAMKKAQEALPASTFTTFETTTFKDVKDTVDEQSSTITNLSSRVDTKADSSTVTTLSNTVSSVSQTATSNSSKLSQLTTTLGTNADGTTKTGDVMHRMTATEQDLDGFKTTVSQTYQTKSDMSNYSTTTQMESKINQKASEISLNVAETYTTKEDFNNLEIGGRNFLKDSDVSSSSYTVISGGEITNTIPEGTQITISIRVDAENVAWASSGKCRVGTEMTLTRTGGGAQYIGVWAGKEVSAGDNVVEAFTGSFHGRIRKTFTLLGDFLSGTHAYLYQQGVASGNVTISNVKIEIGNKATDWTPAPEDLENYADSAVTSFASRFSVTPENISSEVTALADGSEISTRINQTANTVLIQASKVNIEGAAIFDSSKNGRLSTTVLNNTYERVFYITDSSSATEKNINNMLQTGTYYCSTNITNAPMTHHGVVIVTNVGTRNQEYHPDAQTYYFRRTYNSSGNAWNDWVKIDAAGAQEALDNLEIGGRNLLKTNQNVGVSETRFGATFTLTGPSSFTLNGTINSTGNWAYGDSQVFGGIMLEPGQYIANIESSDSSAPKVGLRFGKGSSSSWFKEEGTNFPFAFSVTEKDVYYAVPLHARDTVTYSSSVEYKIKLEKGNVATAWTPAVEDSVGETQQIYCRSNSSNLPSVPTAIVTNTSDTVNYSSSNVNGTWTITRLPMIDPSNTAYKYCFTCEQQISVNGYLMGNSSVVADKAHTVIDGGSIITQSITAEQIRGETLTINKFQSSAQSEILNSNVSVGGRNLFGYGSQCESLDGFYLSGAWDIVTEDGYKCAHASGAFNDTRYLASKIQFTPKPKETVTISGYIKIKNIVYGSTNPMCEFYLSGQTIDGEWRSQSFDAVYIDGVLTTLNGMRFPSYISDTNWHHVAFVRTWHNYTFTGNLNPGVYLRDSTGDLYIRNIKYERGNKATDWTPAPEDVQAEIDAKKSVHTIQALNSSGSAVTETYATLLSYSTEGRTELGCRVASIDGIKAGDTVRVAYVASDMNNATVYIVGTVTRTSLGSYPSIYWTSHGLDTTVIDGGHILTGTIDANRVNISNLTVGAMTQTEQNKILNSNIQIGGRNLTLVTPSRVAITTYNPYIILTTASLVELGVGTQLTIQLWGVELDSNSKGVYPYWGGGSVNMFGLLKPDANGYICAKTTITNDHLSHSDSAKKVLYLYNFDSGHADMSLEVAKWKLEIGNVATDWSPAPEDGNESQTIYCSTDQGFVNPPTTWVTYTGKNLVPIDLPPATVYGVTYTPANDYIIANGTITGTGGYRVCPDFTIPEGTYYAWCGGATANGVRAVFYIGGRYYDITTDTAKATITIPSGGATGYCYLRGETSGTTVSNVLLRPMLYSSTEPSDAYEPYIGWNGVWTTKRPRYRKNFPNLFVATQTRLFDGSVVCTTPQRDDTTTRIKYVTEIDDNGIWVTPTGKVPTNASTGAGATGTKIDGAGVGIYNAGVNVAQYGSSARIGSETSGHVNIASTGMQVYGSSGSTLLANIGYGSGTSSTGGTADAPYYSLGVRTGTIGNYSVVEGNSNTASGFASHAEGEYAEATGVHAHAQNNGTIARYSQTVIGEYNVAQGSNTGRSSGDLAFIIGNGVSNSARSNALTVDWEGNIKASSFYDTINLSLGSYNASGFLTNTGGTIHFSIPTGRVFPNGTTVSSISFNCVARVANANGTGYYCIKSSNNGTSPASISSLGGSAFYNAGNVAKSISSNMWTISLNGGTNITIAMGSGDDFFSGTSTIRGYTNNQPVALMLTNISVLLSLS